MTTGLFEKHAEKAWLSISQQSVDFVLLMSVVATRSLDRRPRLARGASGGAVGTVLLLLPSTERPSVSGPR